MTNKGGNIVSEFFTRTSAPPSVRSFIENSHGKIIKRIVIKKSPIMSTIDTLLGWISLGIYDENKRKLGYDEMFHLWMELTFTDETVAIFEKNQVIGLYSIAFPKPGKEFLQIFSGLSNSIDGVVSKDIKRRNHTNIDVSLEKFNKTYNGLSMIDFLENGIDVLRGKGLQPYAYDPANNNCQIFVKAMLDGNHFSTIKSDEFILQDTQKLIGDLPLLSQGLISEVISNARFFDTILNGY